MSGDLTLTTVFYSWETDLPGKATRNLTEGCLTTSISNTEPNHAHLQQRRICRERQT